MTQRHALVVASALVFAFAVQQSAFAQTRAFGAKQLILDNGIGNNITIQTSPGSFGSYTWTLPTTAPPGSTAMTPAGTSLGQTLYWDGANWTASSTLFNDGTKIGIGTTTPTYDFQRFSTMTNTIGTAASQFKALIAPSSPASSYDYALAAESFFTGANTISGGITGSSGFALLDNAASVSLSRAIGTSGSADQYSSSQTLASAVGVHGEVVNASTAPITTGIALEGYIFNVSSGSIGTAEGLYLPTPIGTIGSYYGIYQDNLTGTNQWPYWYSDGSTGALVEITKSGQLGIGLGPTPPSYSLDLANTSAITSGYGIASNFDIKAQPIGAGTGRYVAISAVAEADNASAITGTGYVDGIRSESQLNATATAGLNLSIGVSGLSSNYHPTQTVTTAAGLHGEVRNFTSGTIGTASALETAIFNVSIGTINDAKIIHVQNPVNGGTMTNVYGLYVDNLTAGTSNYPVYISDGSSNALFAVKNTGDIGVGTDNPAAKLDVRGGVRIGSSATSGTIQEIQDLAGTVDVPSTAAQSSSDILLSAPTTSLVEGDAVIVRPMSAVILSNSCYTAWVSGTQQITLRFNNYSSSTQDPPSGVFKFTVIQH